MVKKIALYAAKSLAIAIGIASSATASKRDVFSEGPWAGYCGAAVQCTVDFVRVDNDYDMTLRVSDGMDDSKELCVVATRMKLLAFDVLVGDADSAQIRAVYTRTQEVVISGIPPEKCPAGNVNGSYSQFADE